MMSSNRRVPRRIGFRRNTLMVSCATAAIAASILLPHRASAQAAPGAFQGSIQSSTGSVSRATSGTNETITIGSSTATVNWSPYDGATGGGPIDFLPANHVATFVNDPNLTSDYTVLNRIVPVDPTRPIQFNGTVLSQLSDGASTATGGHVWFYSPGGIVIGSTAIFDVGSLLLTTADLPNGFTADSNGFSAFFSAPSDSTSAIQILPGAQINALGQNSYVAVVAPRVEQGGTVKVDGSAAYVAATALTMTMNQGLFDIQVDVGGGTDDSEGIVHTGSTTGDDTSSLSANHRIYMVAVPKNQALTMLLGGTAGYDASVAGYENGKIVLTTGYNLNDLAGDLEYGYNPSVNQPGGIQIDPGTYLSDVVANANGSIDVAANSGAIDFKGNLSLSSIDAWDEGTISLEAANGNTLNVAGDATLFSKNPLYLPETQLKVATSPGGSILIGGNLSMTAQSYPGYGGSAQIDAFGGSIAIGGVASVNVDGIDDPTNNYGDQRRGGSINISSTDYLADQGSITANGMVLSANAVGHDNSGIEDWQFVDATGGTIYVNTGQGGDLLINGDFSALASAFGGSQLTAGMVGGQARGGEVYVSSLGGTLHITGNATAAADGTGGDGAAGIDGGDGFGGFAQFYSGGDGSLTIGGTTLTSASGAGGNGQEGGFGQGGHSGVSSTGGSVTLGGNTYAAAIGTGGNASMGFGGTGGNAQGGVAYIEADSSEGGTAGSITGTTATISSDATGGTGGAGDGSSIAAGAGGSAAGGLYEGFDTGGSYALADVNGATLSLTSVVLSSSATGGAGGTGGAGQAGGLGGDAIGGTAQAGTWNPTATTDRTGSAEFADVNVAAKGRGGNGGAGGAGDGDGGTGTGGGAIFAAAGDTFATYVNLNANGTGGNGANGGIGYGGSGDASGVLLFAAHDSNMTITGNANLFAIGQGGFASTGTGGTGYGGDAVIQVLSGGSITGGDDGFGGTLPTGDIWVYDKGQGGDGGTGLTGGAGGDGYGGNGWLLVDGALHSGETVLRTLGVGGTGGTGSAGFGGDGGYGHGGTNIVTIGAAGSFDSWEFTGFTTGVGGDVGLGTSGSGNGGNAQGGSNTVTIDGEASAIGCLACGPDGAPLGFVVTAYGFAANGRNGGNAVGGTSSITVNGSLTSGSIVEAAGQAGAGSGIVNGGDATAGSASITVNGNLQANSVFVGATATAGDGGSGIGGDGYAGDAEIDVDGSVSAGNVRLSAQGFGGNGVSAGGEGDGGWSNLDVTGSLIAGTITADATGTGGNASAGIGGDGFGGDAEAGAVDANGQLTVSGLTTITANGVGGGGTSYGGFGYGGTAGIYGGIDISDIGGTASFADAIVQANGTGGFAAYGGQGFGGDAFAGTREGSFTLTGTLTGSANGSGGGGTTQAGIGWGGTFLIAANFDGDLNPAGTSIGAAALQAIGMGGNGSGSGIAGGDGVGGTITIQSATANASLDIGALTAKANGQGGDGGSGASGGAGGSGEGGYVYASILGTMTGGEWDVLVRGIGGDGGSGSSGLGGDGGYGEGGATSFYTGSESSIDSGTYATSANGVGGVGGTGSAGFGNGGEGQGGYNEAVLEGSDANFSDTFLLTAFAMGGNGATGGSAFGGSSYITVDGSLNAGYVQSTGQAQAGNGTLAGGDASGGDAYLTVNGSLSTSNSVVGANATGGNGATGGSAYGGYSGAIINGSADVGGSLSIQANATGGSGSASDGGYAEGGESELDIYSGATFDGATDMQAFAIGGSGANGGAADGGFADLYVAGTLTAPSVNLNVTGTGGNGTSGNGGDSSGGYAALYLDGGSVDVAGSLGLNANGNTDLGGDGIPDGGAGALNGGDSYGGAAIIEVASGSLDVGGETDLLARAVGGHGGSGTGGIGGTGGAGFGGEVAFFLGSSTGPSSSSAIHDLVLNATGRGGGGGNSTTGGTGGQGDGGYALVELDQGSFAAGDVSTTARGAGGDGGSGTSGQGGDGGSAEGGYNYLLLASGASMDALTYLGIGNAQGGNGGSGGLGGGDGGSAFSGFVTAEIDGAATIQGNPDIGSGMVFTAFAQGGNGAVGGSATAGSSSILVNGSLSSVATVQASASAVGGDGSIAGGSAEAGYASIDVNGSLAAGRVNVIANAIGGTGPGTSGYAWGGSAGLILDPAAVTDLGDVFVSALGTEGSAVVGDLVASGVVELDAGGDISFANVDAASLEFDSDGGSVTGGNIAVSDHVNGEAEGAIELGGITAGPGLPSGDDEFSVGIASATSITVGNVSGAGNVGFATLGDLNTGSISSGNAILAMVGGNIATGSLTTASTGQVYLADSSMFFDAGGPDEFDPSLVFASSPVPTGGSITIGGPVSAGMMRAAAGGDFTLGSLSVAGNAALSAGGNLAGANLTAGGALTAVAGKDFTIGNASSGQNMTLIARGDFSAGNLSAGGTLTAAADGNLIVGDVSSDPSIILAAGQNLVVGNVASDAEVGLVAGGNLSSENVSATTVSAFAGGSLSVEDVNASTSANFLTEGLATFLGTVSAPVITVASGDIDIADGASLGVSGITSLLTLNALADGPVYLGSISGVPEGAYHLDENGDIFAQSIIINAVAAGEGPAPDIIVGDAQIEGSQTSGGGTSLVSLNTGGSVLIDGDVTYVNAGPSDHLAITAGDRIALDTDTGSITMTGPGGILSGTLALTAHNVWAADGALLAQLQADPNFPGRDAALATNNGATNPGGYLQAGAVVVTMTGSSFLVQNTGTATQPAGLTVGDGGLTIINAGSDAATVIVSGRQVTSGGSTVDGNAFAGNVDVESPGGITSDSTVNGCAVGGCAGPEPEPEPSPPPAVAGSETILGPIGAITEPQDAGEADNQADDSDDDSDDDDSKSSSGIDPTMYLINTAPMHVEHTIDQPITSGSDTPSDPQ